MIVRELITMLGWDLDESGANRYDKRTKRIQTDTTRTIDGLARSWETFGQKVDRVMAKADAGLGRVQSAAQGVANSLGGIGSMLMGGLGFAHFANVTSEYTDLASRLKVATEGTDESSMALMRNLQKVALNTYQGIDQTVDAFLQMKPGLDQLGLSVEEQTSLIQSLNDAMTVGGIKGDKAASIQMWLSRSFSEGKVGLEAFNEILRAGDDIVVQWTKNSGKSIEELREMAKAGKLTSRWLADHYINTMERMRALSEEMPVTLNDAMKRVSATMGFWIFEMDRAWGVSQRLAKMFVWLADKPYLSGSLFFGGMGLAAAALAAQMVASLAAGGKAVISLIGWLRKLRTAQIAAALTNPFFLAAAGITALVYGIQDLKTWMAGGDAQIGRWVGSLAELEAKGRANRTWIEETAVGLAKYQRNMDAAAEATGRLWERASNPPPQQTWTEWFQNLGADLDKVLFGEGGVKEWSPFTIDKEGPAADALAWFDGLLSDLGSQWDAAWTTMSTKVGAELSGAWANVKAGWSDMVEGFKSTWSSAVDSMVGAWQRFKDAIGNTALGRAARGVVNTVSGAMGWDAPEVPGDGGTPIPQRRGGGPVNRGLYLVGEEGPEIVEMGGSGFVTPARQTRTYFDSLIDRGAAFGDRAAMGAAAVAMALTPVAAAAGAPAPAAQAAYMRPASAGGGGVSITNGDVVVNVAVTTTETSGMSPEAIGDLVGQRAAQEAERALRRAVGGAMQHFTDTEE